MIQRIQTLFLALAAILLTILLLPIQSINWIWTNGSQFVKTPSPDIESFVTHHTSGNILEMAWVILASLLTLSSIFLYANRSLQAKMTLASVFTTLLGLTTAAFSAWKASPDLFGSISWGPGLFAYLAASTLQYLAFRKIRKDEKLVRSMDRLR